MTAEEELELHEEVEAFWGSVGERGVLNPVIMREGARLGGLIQEALLDRLARQPQSATRALKASLTSLRAAIKIYEQLADDAEARH